MLSFCSAAGKSRPLPELQPGNPSQGGGDYSCIERRVKVCTETDSDSLICQLIKSDKPETSESIREFFGRVADLDQETRDDLVCARLFGNKFFSKIYFLHFWKQPPAEANLNHDESLVGSANFSAGEYYCGTPYEDANFGWRYCSEFWDIEIVDPRFEKIYTNLIRMKKLNPNYTGGNFSMTFEGFVQRVEFQYKQVLGEPGREMRRHHIRTKIVVRDARPSWISTSAGKGTLDEVLKASNEALKKQYDYYMSVDD